MPWKLGREERSEGVSEDVIVNIMRNPNSGICTSIQIPLQWVQCVVIGRGEGETLETGNGDED